MRFPLFVVATLPLLVPTATHAADLNGYSAQYECRASGKFCNVDVAALGNLPCDQTITTSTAPTDSWSAINFNHRVICIRPGDHTGRGTLTIPTTANGTSTNYKVLRYDRSGDTDDDPWNQGSANRATVSQLVTFGDYWLVHRLDVDPSGIVGVKIGSSVKNIIYNRVYVHDADAELVNLSKSDFSGAVNITIQNSVLHDTGIPGSGNDRHCIAVGGGEQHDLRFVNNEIFNCAGDGIQKQRSNPSPGLIVENNDIYLTSAYYSDGLGNLNPNGPRACAENALDFKDGGGSSDTPIRVIHNRLWGFRQTDSNCAGTGSGGDAIILNEATDLGIDNAYGLIQNNILMDGTHGISAANGDPRNWSIIGNLFYNFFGRPGTDRVINLKDSTAMEVYLNTFINVFKPDASLGWINAGTGPNKDVRCNAVILGGTSSNLAGAGTVANHQAYYDSAHANEATRIDKTVVTRANSSSYNKDQVMRTSAIGNCSSASNSACFLYRAIVGGVSAGSAPTPCTKLNCAYQDGEITWLAIRGPFMFYRKLRTRPELIVVPYALPQANPNDSRLGAEEAYTCPANYAARPGVGIHDAH